MVFRQKKLIELGTDQNPFIEKDTITYDLLHKSGDKSKTMGAFIVECFIL